MSKVILYIATSSDGFIADKNGDVDWLPQPKDDHDLEVVGYKKLMERIDTIVMGSRSYKQILGFGQWAWPDKQTIVFTSQPLTTMNSYINFTSDSPRTFMNKNQHKNIWLLGGAELVKSFAQERLIDECIITVSQIKLGTGIKLELPYNEFILKEEKTCMDNMIQRIYKRKEYAF